MDALRFLRTDFSLQEFLMVTETGKSRTYNNGVDISNPERFSGGRLRPAPDSESHALHDIGCRPTPWLRDWRWRLSRLWRYSTGKILLREIGKIPARMRAIHQKKYLRLGTPLAEAPIGYGTESFDRSYTFQRDCSSCIQQLQEADRWASDLDLEMAAKAFQRGAEWGFHNACTRKNSADL